MEYTQIEVPSGDSREDIKAREKIISDVYRKWYEENPSKAVYNADLQDNIKKTIGVIKGLLSGISRPTVSK